MSIEKAIRGYISINASLPLELMTTTQMKQNDNFVVTVAINDALHAKINDQDTIATKMQQLKLFKL